MGSSGLICHYRVDLMHPHFFKKNPNQSCPKKKINKYANTLDALFKYMFKRHSGNINMTTVFEITIFFRKEAKPKFDLFKKL